MAVIKIRRFFISQHSSRYQSYYYNKSKRVGSLRPPGKRYCPLLAKSEISCKDFRIFVMSTYDVRFFFFFFFVNRCGRYIRTLNRIPSPTVCFFSGFEKNILSMFLGENC
jgi:hypothetical protein